jgi:hypothetical protein
MAPANMLSVFVGTMVRCRAEERDKDEEGVH